MKKYFLTFDTETCNGLDDPLVYDLGIVIYDRKGKVVDSKSLVIKDIYYGQSELMNTCYYADKLPQYEIDIQNGLRECVTLLQAKKIFAQLCKQYHIKQIMAHNIRFDVKALQTTIRYCTKSRTRYFLPCNLSLYDTLALARKTILKDTDYVRFCNENGFVTPKYKKPQVTAQTLYRYLSNNLAFNEEHQGLADCMIEKDIYLQLKKRGVYVSEWGNTWLPAYILRIQ